MPAAVEQPIAFDSAAVAALLTACARANLGGDQSTPIRRHATLSDADWEAALRISRDHGVLPLLHRAIERECPDASPSPARQTLRQRAQDNARRNLMLMRELLKLISAMRAESIRVLPYKGPLLAMTVYGDPSLRQCSDLDIIVPEPDIPRARNALENLGYHLTDSAEAGDVPSADASAHEYHHTYMNADSTVMIELHWQVIGRLFSFAPNPIDLWNRSTAQTIAGMPVHMMSPEDQLLILAAHGTKHFWTRLTWICDIAQCLRKYPTMDWDALLQRAAAQDARGMLLVALLLANEALGITLPPQILSAAKPSHRAAARDLAGRLFLESANPNEPPRGSRMQLTEGGLLKSLLFHVRTRESWASAIRYCFHRAVTPNKVDQGWMQLPRPLRFLYYPLRPLRLLVKYGPGSAGGGHATAHRAGKFIELSATDQRRVIQSALLVIAIRLGLWVLPYRVLRQMVDAQPRHPRQPGAPTRQVPPWIARNIVSISRFIPEATCLTQALATHVLLRREGFDPQLQLGVARDGGVFKAHAWVECNGQFIVGDFQRGPVVYAALKTTAA